MFGVDSGAGSGAVARQHWVSQVDRHAHEQPTATAMAFEGREISWGALADRTRRLAIWLGKAGVNPGDRVALAMGNRPEFIEILVAVSRLGAISVPLNFRLAAPEMAYILEHSEAQVVVSDPLAVDTIRAVGTYEGERHLHVGVEAEDNTVAYTTAVQATVPEGQVWLDVAESEPALIMYTSGTTGRPKGAVLTYMNLLAQSSTLIAAWSMRPRGEVNLISSPLFHIGALGSVAPSLLLGATMVIAPSGGFEAGEVIDTIQSHGVTSMFLVPAQWQLICDELERDPRPLPTLRVASWGAAPASETLLRRIAALLPDTEIVALFGQTEMSPVTCVLEGKDAIRKVATVGRPAPQVSIRVVDQDMVDVPPGEIGEIVYRGPGTMSHYWNDPEGTAAAFAGGWFHSGDLVSVDDEGFVTVRDRTKDMLISGGENIYSVEVENVLGAHPAVAEVSLVGRDDPKWGQIPVAVVALRPGAAAPDLEELRDWAGAQLARFKLPRALEVVEALPRNATGKVDKLKLREAYG